MEQVKTTISPDFLYKFLGEHNMTTVMISKKMGVSETIVGGCFRHALNRHGKPLSFSQANIVRLNAAIQQIAVELRQSVITFGSDETFTNSRGKTYDPGTVPTIHRLGEFFNLTALTDRLLGWKNNRKNMVLGPKSSPVHGNVTKEDVDRINAELLSVAGVLSSYEVVADESSSQTTPKNEQNITRTLILAGKGKGRRKCMEKSFESPSYPWDDTTLPLQERSRLFRDQFSGGILLFRVNGGYTAEGDDALLLQQMDSSIVPYTNVETGLVTAWMDSDAIANILPRLIAQDKRVMFTNMYKE